LKQTKLDNNHASTINNKYTIYSNHFSDEKPALKKKKTFPVPDQTLNLNHIIIVPNPLED
jgi:hypothetical protein